MRLVNFSTAADAPVCAGVVIGEKVAGLAAACSALLTAEQHAQAGVWFASVDAMIQAGEPALELARQIEAAAAVQAAQDALPAWLFPLRAVQLSAPLLRPASLRDFYAFEQHVRTAHANRGREVPVEWYQFPVFYFSNAASGLGPGAPLARPAYTQALDYELEVACVIGRAGRDIQPEEAMRHVLGFTLLNDWSARDVQRLEMRVGLGPAKAKDFGSSLGPWMLTPDELEPFSTGRPGVYDVALCACVNGQPVSRGNWKDLHYSFGEMIARASQAVTLHPGDVIGSGTVGSGCLLEVTAGNGPWLQPGDVVTLDGGPLGVLENRIV